MTEAERQAAGLLWNDWDAFLEEQKAAMDLVYDFNHCRPSEVDRKQGVLKKLLGHVGEGVTILPPLTLTVGRTISLGDGCYFNVGATLEDAYTITIGDQVMFGPNVTVCTTGHPLHPAYRYRGMYSAPVTIEDRVWVGANATILPGVTIGHDSVIAAGSVVNRDIPPSCLAGGVPCRVIREFDDRDSEYYFRNRRFDEDPEAR